MDVMEVGFMILGWLGLLCGCCYYDIPLIQVKIYLMPGKKKKKKTEVVKDSVNPRWVDH